MLAMRFAIFLIKQQPIQLADRFAHGFDICIAHVFAEPRDCAFLNYARNPVEQAMDTNTAFLIGLTDSFVHLRRPFKSTMRV